MLCNFIDQAIQEDVGDGDITTLALGIANQNATAVFLVKQDCRLAGVALANTIFQRIDPSIVFNPSFLDGDRVKAGTIIGVVTGDIHSLLKAERLVLNAIQRMSGIATKTTMFVDQAKQFGVAILDTRKTTPNFRICEKWAVAIGGGKNHRYALYDQILIKDNHITIAGGIEKALDLVTQYLQFKKMNIPIIVEVKNETEFVIAIQYHQVSRILMDNFKPDEIKRLIASHQFSQQLEASGGINLENMTDYLQSGIHCLSIGDLTHHIQSVDISLKIQ
jgi:nicotinate-nucleotide pyrophosphorylase (carboxylating)